MRLRGAWLLAVCVAAAAFSSGPRYLVQVALSGRATDFTRDYVAAAWLAQGRPLRELDGATGNAEARRLGAEPVLIPCGPFHLHPPPASLPVRALVPLGFRGAALAWMILSVLAVALLARLLVALAWPAPRAPPAHAVIVAFLALVLWPPTVMNLAFGQWSAFLATLVVAGWYLLERGRPRSAAAALGAAVTLKSTPAVLLGYLALRRPRALAGALAWIAVSVLVAWPLAGGLDAWRVFLRDGRPDVVCWEAYVDNTVSITGVLARLFVGGRYIEAPFHAPAVAHVAGPLLALGLVGVATALTWRRARARTTAPPDAVREGPLFAMWGALVALLNPLAWTHNALFLLLPAVLVARATRQRATRIALGVALVALSVPRETLFTLAGPLPFTAARGWILGVHAAAGLTIYVCAVVESGRTERAPATR